MHAKIQKWGNSLALRIPMAFAKDVNLTTGSQVDLSVRDGRIVIDRDSKPQYVLATLLKQITRKNRHTEVSVGQPVGREIW